MKHKFDGFKWKYSSTWRFFLYTFFSFIIIIALVTGVYYFSLNRVERNELANNLLHIQEGHVPFLVTSLWITDYEGIRQQLGVIAKLNYIERVEIKDEEGTVFYTGSEKNPSFDINSQDLFYTYKGEEKKIGVLTVYINRKEMKADIIRRTLLLFLIELIFSLILASFIAGIFYLLIGRHLLQFAQFIEDDNPQKGSFLFNLERTSPRNDELQILVDHFNRLREQIRGYIAELQQFSYQDQLTDLYNHRFLIEELKRLDTERNLPLSVIIIDLNNLKLTNDTFGHAAGDKLLKKAAEVLIGEFRADEIIARMGGDEFVVLLPKIDKKQAGIMAKRVIDAFEKEVVEYIPLSASFGWETKDDKGQKIASIFKKAEDQMYNQKLVSKNKRRKSSVESILQALFKRQPGEEIHSERVSIVSEKIAVSMGMKPSDIYEIKMAGKYHDIGKIAINTDILSKKEPLSESEKLELKRHPELSFNILNSVQELGPVADIALYHHERWDGKGYPAGLKVEEIPIQSRIVAVANVYEAITGKNRQYSKPLNKEEAAKELEKGAGSQFDPNIVGIFLKKVLNKIDIDSK
ncbi:MAG: diguanylate cyclase [Atribacterota bacterium]|jgi:diguanylate cyclase (GGDEF)-like protein|nr:diguanylate cyclase [Atribacterota bacterium]MDY0382741.1 diguanylate cyclase [Atribacterota bacterium]